MFQKIVSCALGSNPGNSYGRIFLLSQSSGRWEIILYSPNNACNQTCKEKDNSRLGASSNVNCGDISVQVISACHGLPCTKHTVLLLIPQGKTSSYQWQMFPSPQQETRLMLFCFKVSFTHKQVASYFLCIYHSYTLVLSNLIIQIPVLPAFLIVFSLTLVTVLSYTVPDIFLRQVLKYV